jgi:hypothetical protein
MPLLFQNMGIEELESIEVKLDGTPGESIQ